MTTITNQTELFTMSEEEETEWKLIEQYKSGLAAMEKAIQLCENIDNRLHYRELQQEIKFALGK